MLVGFIIFFNDSIIFLLKIRSGNIYNPIIFVANRIFTKWTLEIKYVPWRGLAFCVFIGTRPPHWKIL